MSSLWMSSLCVCGSSGEVIFFKLKPQGINSMWIFDQFCMFEQQKKAAVGFHCEIQGINRFSLSSGRLKGVLWVLQSSPCCLSWICHLSLTLNPVWTNPVSRPAKNRTEKQKTAVKHWTETRRLILQSCKFCLILFGCLTAQRAGGRSNKNHF